MLHETYSHAGRLSANYSLMNDLMYPPHAAAIIKYDPFLDDIHFFPSLPSELFGHSFLKGLTLAWIFTALVKVSCTKKNTFTCNMTALHFINILHFFCNILHRNKHTYTPLICILQYIYLYIFFILKSAL